METFKKYDCITELFEAANLTLIRLTNGTYSTKEHDSLIIRSKTSPRYPNTFYWNSESVKGSFAAAKQILKKYGYNIDKDFVAKPKTDFIFESEKDFNKIANKINFIAASQNTQSNFHKFIKKTFGFNDSFFKKVACFSFTNKHNTNYTTFLSKTLDNEIILTKQVSYKENGKRDKNNKKYGILISELAKACYLEHLFNPLLKTFIVESEKTALLGYAFFGNKYNFLAVGGKNSNENFEATYKRIKAKYPNYQDANFATIIDFDPAGVRANYAQNLGFTMPKFFVKDCIEKGYDLADYCIGIAEDFMRGVFKNGTDANMQKANISLDFTSNEYKGNLNDILQPVNIQTETIIINMFDNDFMTNKYELPNRMFLGNDKLFRKSFEKFFFAKRKVCLVSPTGTGKTEFIKEILGKINAKRYDNTQIYAPTIFISPRLTNIQDITNRVKEFQEYGLNIYVLASEYDNFENNCSIENADLIITTYASSHLLINQNNSILNLKDTKESTIIIDEIHTFNELRSVFFEYLHKFKGYVLGLTATPNTFVNEHLGLEHFEVTQKRYAKNVNFYSSNNLVDSFANYLSTLDFSNEKVVCFLPTKTLCSIASDLCTSLNIENRVIHADNKTFWQKDVEENNRIFSGNEKIVFSTSVIEAGINLYDKITKIVFIDNKEFCLDPKKVQQQISRFRNYLQPKNDLEIVIFRKDKEASTQFQTQNYFDILESVAKKYCFALNNIGKESTKTEKVYKNGLLRSIESELERISLDKNKEKFAFCDKGTHKESYKNIYSEQNKLYCKGLSNSQFLHELNYYDAYKGTFEHYQERSENPIISFTDCEGITSDSLTSGQFVKHFRTDKKILQNKKVNKQLECLKTIENENFVAFESENKTVAKRLTKFRDLGLSFETSKKLVLKFDATVKYGNVLDTVKAIKLFLIDSKDISIKSQLDKLILHDFVENIKSFCSNDNTQSILKKDLNSFWEKSFEKIVLSDFYLKLNESEKALFSNLKLGKVIGLAFFDFIKITYQGKRTILMQNLKKDFENVSILDFEKVVIDLLLSDTE